MVRLQVQFANSSLPNSVGVYERLSREMEAKEGFKCKDRSWQDADGLLGVSHFTEGPEGLYHIVT
jgi:hypothetical protein